MNPLFYLLWLFGPAHAALRHAQGYPKIGIFLTVLTIAVVVLLPIGATGLFLVVLLVYFGLAWNMLRFINSVPDLETFILQVKNVETKSTMFMKRVHVSGTLGNAGIVVRELQRRFPEIVRIEPLIDVSVKRIRDLANKAKKNDSNYELADMTQCFRILARRSMSEQVFLGSHANNENVGWVYRSQTPKVPSVVDVPEELEGAQLYLNRPDEGINARFAFDSLGDSGGKGQGARFVDVEQGWPLKHADFRNPRTGKPRIEKLLWGKNNVGDPEWFSHGTKVLGIVMAANNEFKCLGIAHEVGDPQLASVFREDTTVNIETALHTAIEHLSSGDPGGVLLLELETSLEKLPIETQPAIFDLIRTATAAGIVVIEPAGNGGHNLDELPSTLDSGAIFVAGATSLASISGGRLTSVGVGDRHEATHSTNFGRRIDCYAWGEKVVTLSSEHWAGTSPAAAIIAGAALLVQGIQKAAGRPVLNSIKMREVLRNPALGTPAHGPKPIGVMPDLERVIRHLETSLP